MMIFSIAGRELRSLFLSPLAWTILAVVVGILAYFFLVYLDYYVQIQPKLMTLEGAPGITDMVVAPLFATAATVSLLIVPLLTMRLISEERRNQSLSLLLSAPISMTEIIIGKYLGALGFLIILLLLIILMPLSLLLGASLDPGMLLAGAFGLLLLLASFTALGLFMSTLTNQPVIAAISSFGILILLWVLDMASGTGQQSALFSYLSMMRHYQAMLKGIFSTADLAYYLLFIAVFLILSIRRLDAQRLQG
jgi:ABC-2 type transport system permease protein